MIDSACGMAPNFALKSLTVIFLTYCDIKLIFTDYSGRARRERSRTEEREKDGRVILMRLTVMRDGRKRDERDGSDERDGRDKGNMRG